jgi:dephospho-CoA kinase
MSGVTDPGRRRRPRRFVRRPGRRHSSGPWKHGEIAVIGLVGGIGAGKSTVAELLEARGAFRIDADRVGHALLEQTPCRPRVLQRFGPGILTEPPTDASPQPPIDRRALARIVFSDAAARRDLEAILHPRMRGTFAKAIDRTARRGQHAFVLLDAAILFEAGWDSLCDRVICVDAPRDVRLARLQATRGWTEADLARREAAQCPTERKRDRSSHVLHNAGTPAELEAALDRLLAGPLAQACPPPRRPRPAGANPAATQAT